MRSVVVIGCGMGMGRAIFERLIGDGWAVMGVEWDAAVAADAQGVLSLCHPCDPAPDLCDPA